MKAKAISRTPSIFLGRIVVSVALIAAGLASCDSGAATNANDIVFPESDVSYRGQVKPLFNFSCTLSGCHNSFDRAGNLVLEEYIDLFARPGLVIPNDAERSLLVQVMQGRLAHSVPMVALVSEGHIRGVATWVQEGASNN